MTLSRPIVALAAALSLAAPAFALGRPTTGVVVHSASREAGVLPVVHYGRGGAGFARGGPGGPGGARGFYGVAPLGYAEADLGREDDAALFAARYGCARPIWNPKYNRLMAPCH